MFTAYIDESGTHDEADALVMAGAYATAAQWELFDRRWNSLCVTMGFSRFHMKKLRSSRGDFRGWSWEKKLALMEAIDDAAGVLSGRFCVAIDKSTYVRVREEMKSRKRGLRDTQYGACFRLLIGYFAREYQKLFSRAEPPTFHIVLESGHKNAGDAVRIFDQIKKEHPGDSPGLKHFLGALVFAEKNEAPGLGLADFLAHTVFVQDRRERDGSFIAEGPKSKPIIMHRPTYDELLGLAAEPVQFSEKHF
jgi:hypothetical protein